MARLILLLMLFAALAFALAAAVTAWRTLNARPDTRLPAIREDGMPKSIRNVAYAVLFLLLAGLTSGWLGPT